MKAVLRRTRLVDGSRLENSAEHSWHVALLAVLLHDAAPAGVDHAAWLRCCWCKTWWRWTGRPFCYDADVNLGREDREQAARRAPFRHPPAEQARELAALWEEF